MTQYKRPESVLVVVHTADGEVLLLRRTDVPDFWQSVTGSLRAGETPIEAARRELAEETGLDGSGIVDCRRHRRFRIAPAWRHRYAPGVTHNVEYEFRLGVPVRQRPRLDPREHLESTWLDVPDAAERASSWTNAAAIRSLDSDPARTTVVLVHGLWVGSPWMLVLARRLRRRGFNVALFSWRTTRESPHEAAARLAERLQHVPGEVLHFLGHSMGGMVVTRLLSEFRPHRVGRAVLLGSPLQGSRVAHRMVERRLGSLLGEADHPLTRADFAWPRDVPVAVIAGVCSFGPGTVFTRLEKPNDGTVAMRETRIPGITPRLVRVTHLGLVLSAEVARQAAVYFRDGRLPRRAR